MKSSCSVAQDLMPLYLDQACSEDSKKLVLNHLKECESCSKLYEQMKNDKPLSKIANEKSILNPSYVFKKVKRVIQIKTILLFVFALLLSCYWVLFYLNEYGYLNEPYSYFELRGLVLFLLIALTIILWIWLIMVLRSNRTIKGNFLQVILLILISGVLLTNIYYSGHISTVGGIFSIRDSVIEGNRCYIVVEFKDKDVKLPITYEIYDKVIVDPNVFYDIQFYYNILSNGTGRIKSIDLIDYVDNRKNGV